MRRNELLVPHLLCDTSARSKVIKNKHNVFTVEIKPEKEVIVTILQYILSCLKGLPLLCRCFSHCSNDEMERQ